MSPYEWRKQHFPIVWVFRHSVKINCSVLLRELFQEERNSSGHRRHQYPKETGRPEQMVGEAKHKRWVSLFRDRAADCLTRPAATVCFSSADFFPLRFGSDAAYTPPRESERVTIWRQAEAHVPFGPRRDVGLFGCWKTSAAAGNVLWLVALWNLPHSPRTYVCFCALAWWNHNRHGENSHAGTFLTK